MDLAKLVVKLEAQTAQYMQQLDKANSRLSKFQKQQSQLLSDINQRFSRMGSGLQGALAAVGVGFSFKAIIDATSEAEHAMALLENAVKQTGGAAGFSSTQLADYAGELQKMSTFDDEAIMGAEQLLLRFKSIQGTRFTDATQSTLDLAAALHIDLESAAMMVGKALEVPEKGIKQLAKQGVILSDAQKALVKQFIDTGDKARAQQVILDALESSYGGAARAARDTFGGALSGLKNAFNDLLEGKSGMNAAAEAINQLTDLLNSEEVKKGFAVLIEGFAKIVEFSAKATVGVVGFTKWVSENLASAAGVAGDDVIRLSDKIITLEDEVKRIQKMGGFSKWLTYGGKEGADTRISRYKAQIADLYKQLEAAQKVQAQLFNENRSVKPGPVVPTPGKITPPAGSGPVTKPSKIDPLTVPITVDLERVTPKKSEWDKFLEDAEKSTRTSVDKQIDELDDFVMQLDLLYEEKIINLDEYNQRYAEKFDELVPMVQVTAKRVGDAMKQQTTEVSEFEKQMARNTQDIISDTLMNGFQDGLDGMLKAFGRMLQQMVAQAVAADLAKRLFGSSGGGQGEGWVGMLMNYGKQYMSSGGSRDSGGRGRPGTAYMIGTGAQPEMFVPDSPGTFVPANQWGGGGKVEINFSIAAPNGRVSMETQQQVATRTMQALQQAQRRNA